MILSILLLLTLLSSTSQLPPNIIYILADDLGYEDLGFQGSDILTPNIDRLAKEGVILENHYVMPQCSPSRAALLTGKYPTRTGFWYGNLSPYDEGGLGLEHVTIADMLKSYGYATHLVGKWHLGMSSYAYTPVMRGFKTFLGQYQGSGDKYTHMLGEAYDMRENYINISDGRLVDTIRSDLIGNYSTFVYTQRALDLIKEHSNQQPWFIFLSYTAPHRKYQAPDTPKYTDHLIHSSVDRKVYATMVSLMDEGVGLIADTLSHLGLRNNTLIVFSSDNGAVLGGGGSNYPLKGGKKNFYEGGVRGVSFVNSPMLRKTGYVNRNLHHIVDWFPTFRHLAREFGEKTHGYDQSFDDVDLDGVNIWASLRDGVSVRIDVLLNIALNHEVVWSGVDAPVYNYSAVNTTIEHAIETMMKNEDFVDGMFIDDGNVFGMEDRHQTQYTNSVDHSWPDDYLDQFKGNAFFAYRWYFWKIIVGFVGNNTRTYSKTLSNVPSIPHQEKLTYIKLFSEDNIKRVQLYNLNKDPSELDNVASDNPTVVRLLWGKLVSYYYRGVKPLQNKTWSYDGVASGAWYPWTDSDVVLDET